MSHAPEHFAVWTEIPVTDMDKAIAFYNAVFKIDLKQDNSGPNPMAVFPTQVPDQGVSGHLYPGTPAKDGSGPTIHMASPDALEDALERVKSAGGEVLSEPIAIPVGRFAYCRDPDGNSIGLFTYAEPSN